VRYSSLILASVVVAGLAAPARAQEATRLDAQVPFAFTVGKAQLPAGHYEITSASPDEGIVTVRNMDTGKSSFAEYVTRIGSRGNAESVLVFDVIGNQHMLSEVHVAGADGYLLPAAGKKPHTHKQVKAEK
jgi:hypothetical protein